MKITCKVIESLLPLYADDMVSEDSIALVEEHLDDCDGCRQYLEDLKNSNPMYDIDDVTSQKLASSNTLVKIKKNYHWFLMNIGYSIFLISNIFYFMITNLLGDIMYLDSLGQIVTFTLFSCTFAFSLFLMIARFFCKSKTIKQKDKINKITIVTSILLVDLGFILRFVDWSNHLIYHLGTMVVLGGSLIYIGLKLYEFYNLSFTLTSNYYIKNAMKFTIVTALIMMFDKFRFFVYWLGIGGNIYWLYSSVITIVIALVFLIFAIKLYNFDLLKPKQVITKEFKIIQSVIIVLVVFLQGVNSFIYNLKFVEYENIWVYVQPLQTMSKIADYSMVFISILFIYSLYSVFKSKQYVIVWVMMQIMVLANEKVAYLDLVLGNMDDPAHLPLNIYWVFCLTLIPTIISVGKLIKTNK